MKNEPMYLGDSVYAQPWPGGGMFLTTGSHKLEEATNTIFLEDEVIKALLLFLEVPPK